MNAVKMFSGLKYQQVPEKTEKKSEKFKKYFWNNYIEHT